MGCAYAVDRPLIPPGVEPAGHTHAFDIYTNPFPTGTAISTGLLLDTLNKSIAISEKISVAVLILFALGCTWLARDSATST